MMSDISYENRKKLVKYDSKLYNASLECFNYISSREWNFHLVYTFAAYIFTTEYQQIDKSDNYWTALISIVIMSGIHVTLISLYKLALQNKFHPWRYMLIQILTTMVLNLVIIILSTVSVKKAESDSAIDTRCIRQYWFIFGLYIKTLYTIFDIQFKMRLLAFTALQNDSETFE
jgi:hypothetical protein